MGCEMRRAHVAAWPLRRPFQNAQRNLEMQDTKRLQGAHVTKNYTTYYNVLARCCSVWQNYYSSSTLFARCYTAVLLRSHKHYSGTTCTAKKHYSCATPLLRHYSVLQSVALCAAKFYVRHWSVRHSTTLVLFTIRTTK